MHSVRTYQGEEGRGRGGPGRRGEGWGARGAYLSICAKTGPAKRGDWTPPSRRSPGQGEPRESRGLRLSPTKWPLGRQLLRTEMGLRPQD